MTRTMQGPIQPYVQPRRSPTGAIVAASLAGGLALACLLIITFVALGSRSAAKDINRQAMRECLDRAAYTADTDDSATCIERYKASAR